MTIYSPIEIPHRVDTKYAVLKIDQKNFRPKSP